MSKQLSHTSEIDSRIFWGITEDQTFIQRLRERSQRCEFTKLSAELSGREFYSVQISKLPGYVAFYRDDAGIIDGALVGVCLPINVPLPKNVRLLMGLEQVS